MSSGIRLYLNRAIICFEGGGGGGSDDTGIGWKVNTRQKGICGLDIHDSRDFVHIILVNRGYLSIIRIRKKRDCFY